MLITMGIIEKIESNTTFIKISSSAKNPCLIASKKNENWTYTNKEIRAITGTLTGIFFTKFNSPKNNEEIEVVNLKLQDEGESFILQSARTFPMRNIVNSILGCGDDLGKIWILVYGKQNGDKIFPAVAFKNNDQRVDRLLSIEEQKTFTISITNPKTGELIKNDYSDLNKKFKEELIKLNEKLSQKSESEPEIELPSDEEDPTVEEDPAVDTETTLNDEIVGSVDDLPF